MRNTLKNQIESVLRENPETRNSDISLTIEIWKKYYPHLIVRGKISGENAVYLKDIFALPREDHVKRIRATFQNEEHKYLPTNSGVRKQRKISEEIWRKTLGYQNTLI
jgi:hypothetical protein